MVLHRRDRAGRRVDGVHDRVVQVAVDQLVHLAVQGGREQQPLAVGAYLVEQLGDLRQEAQVGHLVGLVEDGDGDPVEPAVATADEVRQAPRGGDDHVGARAQGARLPSDRHAADDRGQPQLQGPRVRGEGVGHLLRQLPGGHEDQGQGAAALGAPPGGPGQQRETEGQRLARAGAATAQHVTSGERVRQGRRLDGERLRHSLGAEGRQQRRGQAQVGERPHGGQRGGGGFRHGAFGRCGGRTTLGAGPAAGGGPTGTRPGGSVMRTDCVIPVQENLPSNGACRGIPSGRPHPLRGVRRRNRWIRAGEINEYERRIPPRRVPVVHTGRPPAGRDEKRAGTRNPKVRTPAVSCARCDQTGVMFSACGPF